MVLVSGFALGGAVELQDGVDADLPDSLEDCGLVGGDGEFALVFVATEFALDGHMRALGEGAGKIGQSPEGDASMPLGARFPGSGVILPGRLGRQREDGDVGCVADLLCAFGKDA